MDIDLELSPKGSPRGGGRRGSGDSRSPRGRDSRRDSSPIISISRSPKRKSRSPKRKSRSPKRKSRSPKRKEKRKSESPRRRRKSRKSSRSPKRKDRNRKDRSRSPRRKRRSQRRRSGRKGRHSKRSKRGRRREVESSTSRSPVRRSRRRKGYSSSSSISSSSSESVYSRRRRRRRKKTKKRRPVFYRIGDEVEFKKSGSRRRRSRWIPAQVDEIHRGGMYGELTYSIYLLESGKIVDYVRMEELRFRNPLDLERRLREEEIARCREDMRQINLKLARQQRRGISGRGHRMNTYYGGRGRSRNASRSWYRARSADRNLHISGRPDRQPQRAQSVPPGNQTWPEFLAEFAKAACREPKEDDNEYSDHDGFNDVYNETGHYDLDRRGVNIDEMLEYKRDVERTPPINDMYINDRRGNYKMDGKDLKFRGSEMNFNIFFPPCRLHPGGNDLGG